MRRVAVLNDVHGNLPALEAVLGELEQESVELIICGGDLLYGPYQTECLALLRSRDTRFLTGNSEREVLAAIDEQHAWCRTQLHQADAASVARWPASVELEIDNLDRVLFCPCSPRSDEEMLTILTPEPAAREALAGVAAEVVVIRHTHHQFDRIIGATRLVNAGSVGLPYQGEAAAFWALLGPDLELRSTHYNVATAFERLRASGMPGVEELFRESLLEPAQFERSGRLLRAAGRAQAAQRNVRQVSYGEPRTFAAKASSPPR